MAERSGGAGRQVKPRRHASGLWYAAIGERQADGRARREYAPRSVASEREAWRWLEKSLAERAAKRVRTVDVSVFWLCQLYLQDAESRVREGHDSPESDDGRISPHNYRCKVSNLTLAWETPPAPGDEPIRDRPASSIGAADLDGMVAAWRRAGYSPGYVRTLVRTLRTVYRWGARDVAGREPSRLLESDPLAGYVAPKVPRPPDRFVESATVRRFLRWAWARARLSPSHKAAARKFDRIFLLGFRVAMLTGVRPGEAFRLRWAAIDWGKAVAVFPGKATWKTGRKRVVELTPPVLRILRALERLPGRHPEFVFTHMRGKGAESRGELDRRAGEPWADGSAPGKKLRKLRLEAIAAGVEGLERVGPKRLVMYTHRHNYASRALMAGLTTSEAAELLGNTAAVVESTYGHIQREHTARRARELAARRGQNGRRPEKVPHEGPAAPYKGADAGRPTPPDDRG